MAFNKVFRHTTTFERDYVAALVQLSMQKARVLVPCPGTDVKQVKYMPILAINGVRISTQIRDARNV